MVTLKGKFELADVKAAQNLHARSSRLITWVGYYLIGLIVLVFIGEVVLTAMRLLTWTYLLFPAFILGFLALYRFYLRPYQITRSFNQNKELSSPFEMELTDEGYGISNSYGSGKIPWKDFAKWKEDKQIILLYRTDNMFNMIPKRLLHDETEVQHILEMLRQNNVPVASKARNPVRTALWVVLAVLLLLVVILIGYMTIRNIP
jgi:hypothetical protein